MWAPCYKQAVKIGRWAGCVGGLALLIGFVAFEFLGTDTYPKWFHKLVFYIIFGSIAILLWMTFRKKQ